MRLADSLTRDGIEAWTPIAVVEQRRPRSRGKLERKAPIMPSFVFARAQHLARLALLEERPGSHEPFHLFRYLGALPLLSDQDLEPLRSAENQAVPKRRRRTYGLGQAVRVPEGSFAGMSGLVEGVDGKFTLVCFGGNIRVKIATFLLRPDVAREQHSIAA